MVSKKKKKRKENKSFGHIGKVWDFDNFYCWMYGVKKPINEEDQKTLEACYFAMCILLPKELFLQIVDCLGGLKTVWCDNQKIFAISKFFRVETSLVKVRIYDFIKQEEEKSRERQQKTNKKPLNVNVRVRKG